MKVIPLTFVQGHIDFDSFASDSQELLGKLKTNLILSLYRLEEQRFFQTDSVSCPRWQQCPYIVKTFKKLALWNQLADVVET